MNNMQDAFITPSKYPSVFWKVSTMTIEEATDLVLTCTATGHTNLPLWQYLPGMQVTSTLAPDDPDWHPPARIYATNEWSLSGVSCTILRLCSLVDDREVKLVSTRTNLVRPDFTDDLTVQALWLLVVRAYNAADLRVQREQVFDTSRISGAAWHPLGRAPTQRYFGTPVEVFARMLAAAPVKS